MKWNVEVTLFMLITWYVHHQIITNPLYPSESEVVGKHLNKSKLLPRLQRICVCRSLRASPSESRKCETEQQRRERENCKLCIHVRSTERKQFRKHESTQSNILQQFSEVSNKIEYTFHAPICIVARDKWRSRIDGRFRIKSPLRDRKNFPAENFNDFSQPFIRRTGSCGRIE